MYRMRAQNKLFSKKVKEKKIPTLISDKRIILNNKLIYSIIGSYITVFRLINWRAPLDEQHLVRSYCIEIYLFKITEALNQLRILNGKRHSIISLCRSLMQKLTNDPEKNSSWGTAFFVDQYRKIGCKEILKLYDPFEEMTHLRQGFYMSFLSSDNKNYPSKHKIDNTRLSQIQYWEQCKRFFEDMPDRAVFKHNINLYLLSATMFASAPLVIAAGEYFDIQYLQVSQLSWSPASIIPAMSIAGASYFIYFLYQTVKELIFYNFTQNHPFGFDDMTEECQAALFKEISDYLYPPQAETKKYDRGLEYIPPSISTQIPKTSETAFSKEEKYEEEKPLKKGKQKTRPSSHSDHQQFSSSLPTFEYSHLSPPLNIVWVTKSYGIITYWFGHPETYRLWSLLPQLMEFCNQSFVHFPTKRLKEKNDAATVDHYKKTAEIGRLVSDTDRSGFVRASPEILKLKTFSKFYNDCRMPFLLFAGKPVQAPPDFKNAQVYIAQNILTNVHNSKEQQPLYTS